MTDTGGTDGGGVFSDADGGTAATEGPGVDALTKTLIQGSDEDRAALIDDLAEGRLTATPTQRDTLLELVSKRFAPSGTDDPSGAATIRSWMISALLWIDGEHRGVRELALRHVQPRLEPDRDVRYRALRGLWMRAPTYLEEAARHGLGDRDREISALAKAMVMPADQLTMSLERDLRERTFAVAQRALRVMQIVPQPTLLEQVCALLDARIEGRRLDGLALRALAHPAVAERSGAMLLRREGVEDVLRRMANVARERPAERGAIARLLAPIPSADLRQAVRTLGAAEPRLADTLWALNRASMMLRPEGARGGHYIAGFRSEELDVEHDALGVGEDVETLTAVMLARAVDPPLAIGLFGDWGSGKSFFMKAMQKATGRLIAENSPRYCTDVVAIEFNAWHYVDTNLLASLVSHLLERLSAHVSPSVRAEVREADLLSGLVSAQRVVDGIQAEKKAAQGLLEGRQAELETLRDERTTKEIELRDLRAPDLQAVLDDNPTARATLEGALRDLGAPAAIGAVEDLRDAVRHAYTLQGRLMAFAVGLVKGPNRRVMIPLLIFVIATPFALPALIGLVPNLRPVWAGVTTWLAEATALVAAGAHVLRTAGTWVSTRLAELESARDGVRKALDKKRGELGPRERALQLEIGVLKTQEDQVGERLRAATARVAELEQKVADIRDGRSLVRFLSERSGSDDYRRHEGLVATVRRDFEALTERLADPTATKDGRRVERIILYIDDLDRCPEEKVVEVLEAVHLLLAFRLFVVVVGVDPRWLAHALETTYGAFGAGGRKAGWRTTPRDYLEKIFQIPITLRPMSRGGFGRLVDGLLGAKPDAAAAAAGPAPVRDDPAAEESVIAPAPGQAADLEDAAPVSASEPESGAAAETPTNPVPLDSPPPGDEVRVAEEALSISPQEIRFASRLHRLFPTPRATKRFANTWRLLKAGVPLRDLSGFEGADTTPGDFRAPMLLLALVVASPAGAETILRRLFDTAVGGGDVVTGLRALASEGEAPPLFTDIVAILEEPDFPRAPELFRRWLPRVSRFSFDLGRGFAFEE